MTPDVPRLGLVRPPLVYLASLVSGAVLELVLARDRGVAGSFWLLATLVPAAALMHWVVVRREEQPRAQIRRRVP